MRVLRAENYRRMKWKNGGGETAEIAVSPESAGLDDFDWRISMARVEAGGPFSAFPGVDRTLSVLEGEGIVLDVVGRKRVRLTGASAPYGFPADAATTAELVAGPITDLNVMTRRGRYGHKVGVRDVEGAMHLEIAASQVLLICGAGELLAGHGGRREKLGRYDAAVLERGDALRIEGRSRFFLIELDRLA